MDGWKLRVGFNARRLVVYWNWRVAWETVLGCFGEVGDQFVFKIHFEISKLLYLSFHGHFHNTQSRKLNAAQL